MSKPVGPNRALSLRFSAPSVSALPAHGPSARQGPGSAAHCLHDPALVALPIAILLGVTLVVLLFALCQADLELRPAFLPVQLERHQGVAAALHLAHQMIELAPVEQQLARARGIGIDMRGGRDQRILGPLRVITLPVQDRRINNFPTSQPPGWQGLRSSVTRHQVVPR